MKKTFDLIATAAAGLEAVVGREIRNLGIDCQVENGRVRLSKLLFKPIFGYGRQIGSKSLLGLFLPRLLKSFFKVSLHLIGKTTYP